MYLVHFQSVNIFTHITTGIAYLPLLTLKISIKPFIKQVDKHKQLGKLNCFLI